MQIQNVRFIFVTVILCDCVSGYKILGLFGYEGKSHFSVFSPLLRALAEKGHDVTVLSHFPQKLPLPNFTNINISSGVYHAGTVNLGFSLPSFLHRYSMAPILAYIGYYACERGLANENLKDFLNSNPKFDLIITEIFHTSCFLSITQKLGVPVVAISSCTLMPWDDYTVALPSNPSYIPNNFMPFSDKMTFLERVENTYANIYTMLIHKLFMDIPAKMIIRSHFNGSTPDLYDLARNISLFLVNSHFTINLPRPVVPGFVEVGGIHIGKLKKLPSHLEKWINESTHGVVYFSLGSMIKGHTFPDEKKQMFLNAFKRIPQRVLWKWENETMPGKPDNVMIDKWMPQLDVLCHPNVKGFISHGGLLGATEGVHCGVPMIIMPQFGDQFTNAKAVETSGGGVIVDYRNLDEESIYEALTTILSPDFNKEVKELSARFKDRPLPPLETAIYWVEYVARHRGAPHLKTAAVGMPLYQYLLLDVIAFLAVILFSFIFIIYYITRALFRRLCKSGKASAKLKKN